MVIAVKSHGTSESALEWRYFHLETPFQSNEIYRYFVVCVQLSRDTEYLIEARPAYVYP